MESKERLELFQTELDYIKDNKIKKFTEETLKVLPNYFFKIPASSTGKYHPKFSLGDGGLVRHTKVAVRMAIDIMGLEMMQFTDYQKDVVISALTLHDGIKHGVPMQKYSIVEHPLEVVKFIREHTSLCSLLDSKTLENILGCISSHMGMWNKDKGKNEIMPKPKTRLQQMVHLADYLSSRKYLNEFDFDIDIPRK